MMIAASIIGLIGGFAAVGIKYLIHLISDLSFMGDGSFLENVYAAPWYIKILVPMIGGLIVGPVLYFISPESRGSGVPEVMQSVLVKGGIIRPRVTFVKSIVSAISIGTGASVGKEGPIVQVGSSIGSTIGQFLNVPTSRLKVLVGCGAAAGIAAAFNAPVAGALFAIEIILMDFAVSSFSPIVISSVLATVVSHSFDGDFAAFTSRSFQLVSPWEVISYIALGGFAGITSAYFIKSLRFFHYFFERSVKIKSYYKAAIGGAIVGTIGIFFPEIMSSGYDTINSALVGEELNYHGLNLGLNDSFLSNYIWIMALILLIIKIIATSITVGSGGSGGVFAPSLFVGAMLGSFFGYIIHLIFPESTATPDAYALVAMGGVVAGVTRAPITAILIVFELTKANAIILPLMLTCIGAIIVSTRLNRESYYIFKLVTKNINVRDRTETSIMKSIQVSDVISREFSSIPETTKFSQLVETLISERLSFVSIVDEKGNFKGIISLHDIKDHLFDKDELNHVLIAGDLVENQYPKLLPNENCRTAIEMLNKYSLDYLPVMDPDNSDKQLGLIWRKDIDDAYQKEIEKKELTSDLAKKIQISNMNTDVHILEGYTVTEVRVPPEFIGKSLAQLKIRSKFGVDVLSIKQRNPSDKSFVKETVRMIPDANHQLAENDILVVAGESHNVEKLKGMV